MSSSPHPLLGGFSSFPGEEESSSGEEPTQEEELNNSPEKPTKTTQKNHKKENHKKNVTSKHIRRGGIKNKHAHVRPQYAGHVKLFSTNGAGIKNGKVDSLNAEVRSTKCNIVTIQETHSTQKGKIKMDKEFVIFESIRKKKGGGTLIAALTPNLLRSIVTILNFWLLK